MSRLLCFLLGHRTVNNMLIERGFPPFFPVEHAPCQRCGKKFAP